MSTRNAPVTDSVLSDIADALWGAGESCTPIPPLTETHPGLTVENAYRIQQAGVSKRLARGETVVGRKVGLTSLVMQQQLGVDQPDFGVLTDAMQVEAGGVIHSKNLIAPRVEPEFAFRVDAPLSVAPNIEEVRAAIGAVAVSIEIIDSRIRDWQIRFEDTVADNASSAAFLVGDWREVTPDLLGTLPTTEITLVCNDVAVSAGPGSAVLGDPVAAVHWLANTIGRYGQTLTPGTIVLAGSVTAAQHISPGEIWGVKAPGFASAQFSIR